MKINEWDEAELRLEFRRMYRDVGHVEAIYCLFTILKSAQILTEVITEEAMNDSKE